MVKMMKKVGERKSRIYISKKKSNSVSRNLGEAGNDLFVVEKVLGEHENGGLTVSEVVNETGLSRYSVSIALAKLEGAQRVLIRRVGMAKMYFLDRSSKESKMEKFLNHSVKELSKNLRNSRVVRTSLGEGGK